MADYLLLFVGTVLVNNFVLVKFLGLCPFMGFPKNWKPLWGWARHHVCDDAGLYLRLVN